MQASPTTDLDPALDPALDPDLDSHTETAQMPRPGPARLLAAVAVTLVVAPFAAAVATRTGSDWLPVHDVAVIDLRVRDVFTADTPLVGPYSRFGWNHPGPSSYWFLAVWSRVAGGAAWGTLVGGVLLQLIAVAWTAWAAWRIGRARLVLVMMAVVLASYAAIGPAMLLEPWNPHVVYPWLPLLCLQGWRLSLGEWAWAPGFVLAGTVLVQGHVGYAPLVVAVALAAAGGMLVDGRRTRRWTGPSRWTAVASGAIAVALWAPVVVEQLTTDQGNLRRLAVSFLGSGRDQPVAGAAAAAGVLGGAVRPLLGSAAAEAPSFGDGSLTLSSPAWLLVLAGALVVAGVLAWRAGRQDLGRLVVVLGALVAGGVAAITRARGELLPYLFYWRLTTAALVLAVVVLTGEAWLRNRAPAAAARPILALFVVASLAVLIRTALPLTGAVLAHGHEVMAFEDDTRVLVEQLDSRIVPGEKVLVEFRGSTLGGVYGGVVDHLDRRGVQVRVPGSMAFQFGASRAARPGEAVRVLVVTEQGAATDEAVREPGAVELARLYPLGPEIEREMSDLQSALTAQLGAAGRADLLPTLDSPIVGFALADVLAVDPEAAERLGRRNEEVGATGRCRCAVTSVRHPTTA